MLLPANKACLIYNKIESCRYSAELGDVVVGRVVEVWQSVIHLKSVQPQMLEGCQHSEIGEFL